LSQGALDRERDLIVGRTHVQGRTRRGMLLRVTPLRMRGVVEGRDSVSIQQRDRVYRRMLAAADAVAAVAALEVANVVTRSGPLLRPAVVVAFIAVAVGASKLLGLYDRDDLLLRKSTLEEAPAIFHMATLFALLVALSDWQLLGRPLRAPQLFAVWTLVFGLTLVTRSAARQVSHRLVKPERCLVVGDLAGVDAISPRLTVGRGVNAELVSSLVFDAQHSNATSLEAVERMIGELDVQRVILAPREADSDLVLDVVRLVKSLGVKVSLLPRLFEVVGSSVVFDDVNGLTVLGVRRFGLSRSSATIKRATDIGAALLGLIAVAPIMAAVALLIRSDTPGPVFFRQTRVGRDGRHFTMLKFRSMVVDADSMRGELVKSNGHDNGCLFKLSGDPRVTRIGKWLRRSSLDELPQLLNVLRGDMSIVGPRPLIIDDDAMVQGFHRRRLHLTPGMTGPWQALGSKAPLNEMVNMDYLYIANWSLYGDVKIILRTAMHVAARSGI
jgi:exopolysaccharide biosynthesis polyprenyl glycosylphosphotransferase